MPNFMVGKRTVELALGKPRQEKSMGLVVFCDDLFSNTFPHDWGDDIHLVSSGAVSRERFSEAKRQFNQRISELGFLKANFPVGYVIKTGAEGLKAKSVFHVMVKDYNLFGQNNWGISGGTIETSVKNALDAASNAGLRTVSIPVITREIEPAEGLDATINAIKDHFNSGTPVNRVRLVCTSDLDYADVVKAFQKHLK